MFKDLRDYIKAVEELGELQVIDRANWDLEIGALGEIILKITHPDTGSPLTSFPPSKEPPLVWGYPLKAGELDWSRPYGKRSKIWDPPFRL